MEILIGFCIDHLDNCPKYPDDDNEVNYNKWKRDIDEFAKVDGSKFIRNNFPNIININFDELDDDYVRFFCTFKGV